jgi:uncharacterized protein
MSLTRFLLFLLAFLVLNAYLFIRGWQAIPDRRITHTIYSAIFFGTSLSIFIAIFAAGKLPSWLSFVFEQVGGYWVILFTYIVAAVILGDVLRMANHFFPFFPECVSKHYLQVKQGYFGAVLLFLVLISLIGFNRFSHPRLVELELKTGTDTGRSSEITIVAISDLHLGNIVRKRRLMNWVDRINAQKPDIIMLVGDIFDHSYKAVEVQHMGQELGRLRAPYGIYAVLGNHDYYTGVDKVLAYLRDAGVHILRDSTAVIDNRFLVIGRDDLTNRNRKTLASLLAGNDTHLTKIVLDHQPQSMQESIENHIDLHISGHTHNGQIFPFNRIVSKIYELGYGYRIIGRTHFYVSSGIGLWGAPIRLGTQSEIVRIHVMAGDR